MSICIPKGLPSHTDATGLWSPCMMLRLMETVHDYYTNDREAIYIQNSEKPFQIVTISCTSLCL